MRLVMRAGLRWCLVGIGAVACKTGDAPSTTPPEAAVAVVPGGTRPDASALRSVLEGLCTAADGKRFVLRVRLDDAEQLGDVLWAVASDPRPEGCCVTVRRNQKQ